MRNKSSEKIVSSPTQSGGDFHSELTKRLSKINLKEQQQLQQSGRRLSSSMTAQVFIDQHSSADEVANWLEKKGFQQQTRRVLAGYSGSEIFNLSNDAFVGEFGQQEGSRLSSQLKLMKTTAGYTQSGSSQLRKILDRQKRKAENSDSDNDMGSPNSNIGFDLEDSDEFVSASMVRGGRPDHMDRRY